jgi:diguanylate cyclase (GGDEF)-like protein
MAFDTPTLFLCVTIAGFAGSAILLLFHFIWRTRSRACSQSLLLWSAGLFITGNGTVLIGLRGSVPDEFSIILANILILLGTGLRRAGFAAFLGRPRLVGLYVAIAGLWLALCFYTPFLDSFLSRVNFIQACLIGSTLWVIWMAFRQNPEKFKSVRMLGATNMIECAAYVWFVLHQNLLEFPTFLSVFSQNFMTVYLITILFSIIMTIVLPACMVIERASLRYKEQALQDALTGIPNRRAVLNDVEDWISEHADPASAYSLIMFGVDDLRAVNDRFTNAMGDAVLQLFGRILKETSGETAIPGRVEGELFIVFLPKVNREMSFLTAQRICRKLSVACQDASDGKLAVSVSAGLVTATTDSPLERVLEAVDRGLSSAKSKGRGQIMAMDLAPNGNLKKTLATGEFSSLKRSAA